RAADRRRGARARRPLGRRLREADHGSAIDAARAGDDRPQCDCAGAGRRPDRARIIDHGPAALDFAPPRKAGHGEHAMKIQGYPDPGEGLRLHLNENTGGCSPRVLEAIRRVRTTDVSTYPSYPSLIAACARHFDVDPDWILLTNGLDEGILM